MQRLFYPRSVVVIGVSARETNLARMIVRNLLDNEYHGQVYAVGARTGEVFGQQIHGSLDEVPLGIDLAAILTPAATIPTVLEQCGKRGITRAVIMSGGFTEYGADQQSLERATQRVADNYGIRFVGPNCVGMINTAINLIAVFFPTPKGAIRPGPIAFLAQSGTVALVTAFSLSHEGIGVSKVVSLGNKLNIDEVDLLQYLMQDEATDVVCMYLEGVRRGRALFELARTSPKPIAIHKAGVGQFGKRAANSHTAALASDDRVVDAALRQAGVIRVRRLPDLVAAAVNLTLPPMQGDNVGVVGSSGGVSVMASDACDYQGLKVPPFPPAMLDEVERLSPEKVIRRGNPLDFGDMFDNDVFMHSVESVAALPDIHGLVICPRHSSEVSTLGADSLTIVRRLRALSARTAKPIAVTFGAELAALDELRRQVSFPIFTYAEECVEALAMLREYACHQALKNEPALLMPVDRQRAAAVLAREVARGRTYLGDESMEVLAAYGIPVVPSRPAASLAEALGAAEALGYPLVMKVRSPDIVHKSDVGGVVAGIASPEELRQAYPSLLASVRERQPAARLEGVLLQRLVSAGREMILGGKRDEQFGPLVMLGLGGIYVELFGDVALRLAPLAPAQAEQMLRELRGAQLLTGVRGQAPADVASLLDSLLRLAQLLVDFPEIVELDINPMKVLDQGQGSVAVDARLVLVRR